MDKTELQKLQAYLRATFTNTALKVTRGRNDGEAEVHLGERRIGRLSVDDEDGDRSFAFELPIPVQRDALQSYLRLLFENETLKIVARMKKTDSVELNAGSDFLGVISADDPKGKSFTLQMAILDFRPRGPLGPQRCHSPSTRRTPSTSEGQCGRSAGENRKLTSRVATLNALRQVSGRSSAVSGGW